MFDRPKAFSSESSPPHNHHHYRTLLFFHPPTAQNAVHTGLGQPSDPQAHSPGILLKFEANAARLCIALQCSPGLEFHQPSLSIPEPRVSSRLVHSADERPIRNDSITNHRGLTTKHIDVRRIERIQNLYTVSNNNSSHVDMSSTSVSWRPSTIFTIAIVFRLILLLYGRWQDAHSPVKYTDIDYLVFTDAARYVSYGKSPYERATYRYTPLLAWLLIPTTWGGLWFEFGKALFAAGDIVTGWLILRILRTRGMETKRALKFASIWLLNPMVANISTRGSSEGLLAVLVVALLWAVQSRRIVLAGCLLGFAVHFKIYPFIYAASIFWWLGSARLMDVNASVVQRAFSLINQDRVNMAVFSFLTFMGFNAVMYKMYGMPFIEHTYTYHVSRIDHRHNFSVYNTVLHQSSMRGIDSGLKIESLAFLPQLLLSVVVIPLLMAKSDLATTMLAQTFAFVTFNKVCTSQYFLWYMVFLPFYLPTSTLLRSPRLGVTALVLWILGQAAWLQQGFELEFLGHSTFVPGLWLASIAFFLINCWLLGLIVRDVRSESTALNASPSTSSKKLK
ncbi:unnamed protein product [Zymoseptoria tritici ST99CH_1E4]|uniref:GPI mannosyltransferase 1 n=1 Tax=Zymoseptoria tritici ST99CH_1E4 TaxID=1276532 RepID=A0A2H1GGJ9_ZYMTR|nr:unnamed protein product [Zymoseptoria tritici ST99CH_1E4]